MSDHNWEAHYKLKPGDTFVEVGAFYGDDVAWAFSRLGRRGTAIFIEPNPSACGIISTTIAELGAYGNFKVVNNPAWRTVEPLDFYNFGGTTSIVAPVSEREARARFEKCRTEMQAVTIDSIVKTYSLGKIDLICMDVEGVEMDVLNGCAESLGSRIIKNLSICVYHITGTEDVARGFLSKFGKWDFQVSGPPHLHVLHANLLEEDK